ncbi:MAG: 30.2 kDa unknown protein [Plant associated caulimovirus 1]|nr:MAG: 30.2 kDa unknown protein [Plant associated caulimovirus 1]
MTIGQKDKIRDWIEHKFDQLHRITDKLPLGILDGVLHGTSRGIINFLLDNHPERLRQQETSLFNPKIIEFIKFFEQGAGLKDLRKSYPQRFSIFIDECKSYNSIEKLLWDLERGILIRHQLGDIRITLDNIRQIYYQYVELEKALKQEMILHRTILEQLQMSDIEILHELEIITQKLASINLGPEITHLMKRFTIDFLSEMKEIKATIADLSTKVEMVEQTTSDTNTKVAQIEQLTKELNAKQKELEKLLKLALGTVQ